MIPKPIDKIDKGDIDAMLANKVPEGKLIEYKRDLPGRIDKDKKEFCADVSSFANAGGGDMIFGVNAPRGIPTDIPGLLGFEEDSEVRRLEQIIGSCIEPRVPGIQHHAVPGFTKGQVLVMRIPRSWAGPHMVKTGDSRFYSRTATGKAPLDVGEIRAAFAASESIATRIQQWRVERLGKIVADETPARLSSPSRLVLHLVPFDAIGRRQLFDAQSLKKADFIPMTRNGFGSRFNIDGVVVMGGGYDDLKCRTYVQVFRNGCVEAVLSSVTTVSPFATERENSPRQIASIEYEEMTIRSLDQYLSKLEVLGVGVPIAVMVTLVGVKGAVMAISPLSRSDSAETPIDRDVVSLPDVLVTSFDAKPESVLRPVFDAVWNACGLPRSFNYDKDGNWRPYDQ